MNRYMLGVGLAAAVAAAGCFSYERTSGTPTGPGSTGLGALLGNWASTNVLPSRESCTDFRWSVSERSDTSARGSFSATCANDLHLQGTASGTLSGDVITWNAVATASVAGLGSCAITLEGTAELGVDSIRIPYRGDTCLGRVSGVEHLRRR
jgi:hypothetical protein